MTWTTPITDRTASDITGRTSKGFFNVADWSRIDGNTQEVHEQVVSLLGVNVSLTSLSTPTVTDFPSADDVNALIENIDLLRQAACLPDEIGLTALKHDYQVGSASSAPDYEDVNAWENTLDVLRDTLPKTASYFVRCGVGTCGQSRLWQTRFRLSSAPYVDKVLGYAPIAFWRLNEASGSDALDSSTNGYDGLYSGPTLAALTGPDGSNAPSFNGTSDRVLLSSSGVIADLDMTEGTALLWFKPASGVWTDGATRYALGIYASGTNYLVIGKDSSNRLAMQYRAGGTTKQYLDGTFTSTDWVCAVMTWSASADEVKFYIDGAQVGSTQTGLGTWSGAVTSVTLGSYIASFFWSGGLALGALFDTVLSDTAVANLAA